MAASLAHHPDGKVLEVFCSSAEQQGAHDFLSNEHIQAEAVLRAMEEAISARCQGHDYVHVVVDGTSLQLTDYKRVKGFGGIGSTSLGASGLKVVHAYAVSEADLPPGGAQPAVVGSKAGIQAPRLCTAPTTKPKRRFILPRRRSSVLAPRTTSAITSLTQAAIEILAASLMGRASLGRGDRSDRGRAIDRWRQAMVPDRPRRKSVLDIEGSARF